MWSAGMAAAMQPLLLLMSSLALSSAAGGGAGAVAGSGAFGAYHGLAVGALSELHHGVRGRVYAVDARTLYLKDFHYDGEGPAAYFYVGTSGSPSAANAGTRLRDERGGAGPLRRYRGEGAALALPEHLTVADLKWFSVWCDEYSVNFGSVSFAAGLQPPKPARVGSLRGAHGVRSDRVVVVDAQTLLVPNFSYDGEAPDAKFWVGRGASPSPAGIRIPDENGKEVPLRRYDNKTIVLTLPGELTVFDIGHIAVWCEAFTVNFGHVPLPRAQLANVPPSLKMLGVSPQSKLNCEVLLDELAFEVRWALAGDSLVLQLVAKLEDGEYMSFGISGDESRSQMVGADVAVAWVDAATLRGHAVDYYLDAKSQCAGVRGSCPDERLGEKTNSVRLLNAAVVNGYSIVTLQRPLRAADDLDRPVRGNGSQPVVWALGPLNARQEVSYHHHYTKGDKFIEFGRPPVWNCPMPEADEEREKRPPTPTPTVGTTAETPKEPKPATIQSRPPPPPARAPSAVAWEIPGIQCHEPPDGVFYAQMGPTGGKQGYPAITGHVGWGISWYINGLLIPELTVVRGRRYTFVVEGGADPAQPARYHPFYITNDAVGGYFHKSDDEKKGVEIYAGARRSRGSYVATGAGRLCSWVHDARAPEADDYPSFGAFQRSLTLVCEEGSPGLVHWTPDQNTPDTVYYQCFTHRYLGWKIRVVDECDSEPEASESAPAPALAVAPPDLAGAPSLQVHRRVRPDNTLLDQRKKTEKIINTKTVYNDFSSDKSEADAPVSAGQIRDVIAAVEHLETEMKDAMRRNATRPGPHGHPQHPPPQHGPPHHGPPQHGPPHHGPPQHGPPQHGPPHHGPPQRGPPQHGPPSSTNQPTPSFPGLPELSGPNQYQVHEEVQETDGRPAPPPPQTAYFLPHGQSPLTLQSLRPGPPRRRPPPPRRPPHHKLPPPGKKPYMNIKPQPMQNIKYNRPPHGPNRPPIAPPPKPTFPKMPFGPPMPQISQMPLQPHTLSLGRTELVATQVVKTHFAMPPAPPSIATPEVTVGPQIILGKPMDHPTPLDQLMAPTDTHVKQIQLIKRPEAPSPTPTADVKGSDFLGSVPASAAPPAVNTGFKPDTIVVESGFKPIIREPLMDRGEYDGSNRREDVDVDDDYEDSPPPPPPPAPAAPAVDTFQPMFIPSPEDRMPDFPANHAKEDRPHPVYVRPKDVPAANPDADALFGTRNAAKQPTGDLAMAGDRVSVQYLPPDPARPAKPKPEETFTTYDGKTVSASSLTAAPIAPPVVPPAPAKYSAKVPSRADLLLSTPQFGPFRGETPPPVDQQRVVAASAAPELTTHLKLVNTAVSTSKEPEAAASETHDVVVKPEEEDEEEYEDDDDEESDSDHRMRRDAPVPTTNHVESSTATNLFWTNLMLLLLHLKLS